MNADLSTLQSVRYVVPEIALALGALLVVAWGVLARGRARHAGVVAVSLPALGVAAVGSALELRATPRLPLPAVLFDGQLECDPCACAFRLLLVTVTAVVVLIAIATREHEDEGQGTERLALLLALCLGMNLMAMAHTLLLAYLAIETVTLASVVLVGIRGHGAAFKLAVYAGVASGVMLYGMSWLYGLARSIVLPEIGERTLAMAREHGSVPNAVAIAGACVFAGIAAKIAAAPFHAWAPDVHEESPPLVAALLSVGPPAAGIALLMRVLREAFAVPSLPAEAMAGWSILVGSVAVASMTVGNLGALRQTSMPRLLAYASVAQIGTVLLAVCVWGPDGEKATLISLVSYVVVMLGAGLAAAAVSSGSGGDASLAAFRGLGARSPWLAASFGVLLASLVGLPPLSGFVARLYVVAALLRAPTEYHGWYWLLACAAVGNVALSLAAAARVLRGMYLDAPGDAPPAAPSRSHAIVAIGLAISTVVLGLWWGPLHDFVAERVAAGP